MAKGAIAPHAFRQHQFIYHRRTPVGGIPSTPPTALPLTRSGDPYFSSSLEASMTFS